ncbi:MAG: polyhydroxyalkanoic acid system family protein [Candidatus Eremiobacteraeota bacterium]|nr:polyhydroxyalkanoic acid system family protein [Candidatus Eremiobacteraeota bacterium]
MAGFHVSLNTRLPVAEALGKMHQFLQEMKKEYGDQISRLSEQWDDHSCRFGFHIMGFGISGSIIVGASRVDIKGDLPFAAFLFKDQIEGTIRQKAAELLA